MCRAVQGLCKRVFGSRSPGWRQRAAGRHTCPRLRHSSKARLLRFPLLRYVPGVRKVLQGLKSTNQREKLEPVPEADLTETFGCYKVTSTYLKAFKGHLYSSIRACQYEMSQRKVQGEESNG